MKNKEKQTRAPRPPTLRKVTVELWQLYREARVGKIDISDASKLASVLNVLLSGLKSVDIEQRIEALENWEA